MFGGVAETVGIRVSLTTLGIVAFVFALLAFVERSTPGERLTADGVRRAFRDIRFLGGLWLNTLPAMLFGSSSSSLRSRSTTPGGRPSGLPQSSFWPASSKS